MRYALRGVSALLFVCLVSLCTAQNEPQNTQQCVAAEAEQCSGNEAVKDTWEHWVSDVSRRFAKGAASAVATTVLPVRDLNYSPMNVQPPTSSPSFRGWFMRLTDHEHLTTVVVLMGAFTADHTRPADIQHYLFVAVDAAGGQLKSGRDRLVWNMTAFPASEEVELFSEDPSSRICNVLWRSTKFGTVRLYNDTAFADLTFGENHIQANMTSRIPFSVRDDLAGPEGWLTHSSLLPSRYFVHSIGSRGGYRAKLPAHDVELSGDATVHLETNYGRAFPSAWTWIQACKTGSTALALGLVGGQMPVGPLAPMLWGLFVVWGNERLYYRTSDLDLIHYSFNSDSKSLEVFAMPPIGRRHEVVHITAAAPPDSFGDPMFIPTVRGFTDKPGCVESYHSTVRIRVYRKVWYYQMGSRNPTTADWQALRNSSMFADHDTSSALYGGPATSWTQRLMGFGGPKRGEVLAIAGAKSQDDAGVGLQTMATEGWVLVADETMKQAALEFGGGFRTRRGKWQEFDHFRLKWTDTQKLDLRRDFSRIRWRFYAPGYVEQFDEPRLLLTRDRQTEK